MEAERENCIRELCDVCIKAWGGKVVLNGGKIMRANFL